MRPHRVLGPISIALIVVSVVSGQRPSQFSFSQAGLANQLGANNAANLFASNQELSNPQNSAGPQGSSFMQFGQQSPAQQSFSSSLQNQFSQPQLMDQAQPNPQAFQQIQSPFQPFIPQPQLPPAIPPQAPQQSPQQSSQQPPQPQPLQPASPGQQQQPTIQSTRPSSPASSFSASRSNQQQLASLGASTSVSSSNSSSSSITTQNVPVSTPSATSLVSSTPASARRAPQTSSQQRVTAPSAAQPGPSQSQSSSRSARQHQLSAHQQQNQQAALETARRTEATQASFAAAGSGQTYQCPDPFGFYRHHKSCDKYWACENNTATLKLCGNGLMFDDSDPKRENCAYPFSVDCGSDRTDLEPPISTPNCPRLYGLFSDTSNCRVFYSCWNGEASKYECPPGLAYDSEQRVCVWADLVDRCDQSEVSDGFVCPDPTEIDQPGHYTRHAHPTDCRKFYVCIDGVARPYGCSFGTVFNVDSLQCDEPESVSGCEKYYGDLDPKLAKKLARENASGQAPSSRQSTSSSSSTSSN